MCELLRARPNPALISDRPAPASGIKRIEITHTATVVSERFATGAGVTLWHPAEVGGSEPRKPIRSLQRPCPPAKTRFEPLVDQAAQPRRTQSPIRIKAAEIQKVS